MMIDSNTTGCTTFGWAPLGNTGSTSRGNKYSSHFELLAQLGIRVESVGCIADSNRTAASRRTHVAMAVTGTATSSGHNQIPSDKGDVVVEEDANVQVPGEDEEEDTTAGWVCMERGDSIGCIAVLLELGDDDDDDDDGNGGDVVDITAFTDVNILFQLIFTRLRGGPIGGICWVASARYASFSRCGWVATMFFQPTVSTTSVA
uniref:Uncharacterized protein n=1 Tax=Anopheles culicifacies TaxID=139723 RepID=A0A182MQF9_9DIPT